MIFKTTLIICIWAISSALTLSAAQGWHGIVPLHSTRTDVERQLGLPRESRGLAATYDTDSERVLVFYSGERCNKGEWNVPRDTVVGFTVSPNSKVLLSSLKLDKTKYKHVPDYHLQGAVHYVNREDGVRVETRLTEGEDEQVISISYDPGIKDLHLRCPGAASLTNSDVDGPPPYKFDEYSNILASDEESRLDNFAIYLHQNPKLLGYVIAYGGKRASSGAAKERAESAKKYLVSERNIQAHRIVTIDGGYRNDCMVELFTTAAGTSAPRPTPTIIRRNSQNLDRKSKNNRPLPQGSCNDNSK
jgi:hypothetical protein